MRTLLDIYKKLFGLRNSEAETVLYYQLVFFNLLFCLLMIKPTASAIFLAEYSAEYLPQAFMVTAVAAAVVTRLITYLNKYPLTTIIRYILVVCAFVFFVIGMLLSLNIFGKVIPYILFVWVAIFALISTSQLWLLANIIFNANQAKRVFGLIGSGSILGAILGGYFSGIISVFGGANLLSIIVGFLLLGTIYLLNRIVRINHIEEEKEFVKSDVGGLFEPIKLIADTPLLMNLSLLVFANVVASKIIDYHFGIYALEKYPDENDLSAFYGFVYSTFNIIGFSIQLIFTSKVLKKIGVSNTLLILPISALIFFCGLFILPGLLLAVFLKMADTSFKQSFQRSSVELSILPVPAILKGKTKPFIDVFVDSLASGFAGLLLFLIGLTDQSGQILSIALGVLISLLWIVIARKTGKVYLETANENILHKQTISQSEFEDQLKVIVEEGKLEEAKKILNTGITFENPSIEAELSKMYFRGGEDVKLGVMKYLYKHPQMYIAFDLITEINRVIEPKLKQSIMSYAVISDEYKDSIIYPLVDHDDWRIQVITIYALLEYYGMSPYMEKTLTLKKRLDKFLLMKSAVEDDFYINQCYLIYAKFKVEGYHQVIDTLLLSDDNKEVKIAMSMCTATQEVLFFEKLLRLRIHHSLAQDHLKALAGFEELLCDHIEYHINALTANQVALMCKALRFYPVQRSADILLANLLYPNKKVQSTASQSLSRIISKNNRLQYVRKVIANKIVEEVKTILLIHDIKYRLESVQEFNDIVLNQPKSYWIKLRLDELLDSSFLYVLQLLGIFVKDDIIRKIGGFVKSKKPIEIQTVKEAINKKFDTKVTASLEQAILVMRDEYNSPQKYSILNNTRLYKDLLKLNDVQIDTLIKKRTIELN